MTHVPRVAVTGLGCVSALGVGVATAWQALELGQSGIRASGLLSSDEVDIPVSAEVANYDDARFFDRRELTMYDRFTQFALLAAGEAIADAGLDLAGDRDLAGHTAVIIASGAGGWSTIDDAYHGQLLKGRRRPPPLTIPRVMLSSATSHVCQRFGIRGPAFSVSSACSSSNHAIGEAYWMIRSGRARAAIVGGAEAEIARLSHQGWSSLRVLSPDTCRPFSRGRKGIVIGEGAGVLVLERMDAAERRGARIYCELAGYGLSSDAGDIVAPDPDGAARAIRQALDTAALAPEEVDYINAHGTGTVLNDATEVRAIKNVFGTAAARLAVTSTKSMHGHALGASGAIEAVATVKAIEQQVIPPTANYLGPDPDCDLDHVPNTARRAVIRAALSNSLAFGGLNAVLAFKAPSPTP